MGKRTRKGTAPLTTNGHDRCRCPGSPGLPGPGGHHRQGRRAGQAGGRRGCAARRVLGDVRADVPGLGLARAGLVRRGVRPPAVRAVGDGSVAGHRAAGRDRPGLWRVPGDGRQRVGWRHDVQLAAVLRPGRQPRRAAPQVDANGRRAHCVGYRRRVHPGRGAHPVRGGRRVDLLGELHAAGPGRNVRPRRGRLPRPDLGQQRYLGGDTAAYRQGGAGVRAGHRAAACTPRSTRPSRGRHASSSTPWATTHVRMCSACR